MLQLEKDIVVRPVRKEKLRKKAGLTILFLFKLSQSLIDLTLELWQQAYYNSLHSEVTAETEDTVKQERELANSIQALLQLRAVFLYHSPLTSDPSALQECQRCISFNLRWLKQPLGKRSGVSCTFSLFSSFGTPLLTTYVSVVDQLSEWPAMGGY